MKKQEAFDLGGIFGIIGGLLYLLFGVSAAAGSSKGFSLGGDAFVNLESVAIGIAMAAIGILCIMGGMHLRERKRKDKGLWAVILLVLAVIFLWSIAAIIVLIGAIFAIIGAIK